MSGWTKFDYGFSLLVILAFGFIMWHMPPQQCDKHIDLMADNWKCTSSIMVDEQYGAHGQSTIRVPQCLQYTAK